MIENRILNKCCSIILVLTVTVTMLLPSMLMPKEVSAGSVTVARRHSEVIITNGPAFRQDIWTDTSTGEVVYCIDADVYQARYGVKTTGNLLGYRGIPQSAIDTVAIGNIYIRNNYSQFGESIVNFLQQFLVWHICGAYSGKNHVDYMPDFKIGSLSSNEIKTILNKAKKYAQDNKKHYKCSGTVYLDKGFQSQGSFKAEKAIGYAKLKKVTKSNKHLTDLCPEQYSLDGAEYAIYSDSGLTKQVATLKTNASGDSKTIELNEGVYYAKEAKAPKGYMLDPKTYTLNVKGSETATLNVADEPLFDNLSFKIQKRIEEGADKNLSLEGAEYTVKYYKDFLNKEEVKAATPFRTWVFKTNEKGVFGLNEKDKIAGDELFKNDKGIPVGLLGTYTIEETKAPKGLAKTEGIISLQHVKTNETATGVTVMKDVTDIEKTQKVNIKIQKKDAETGEAKPQGYGSFAGAKFNVWMYDPLQLMDILVGTIVTNENGTGELVKLAPGLYTIEEIEAPSGYNKNTSKVKIEARVKELNTAYFDYLAAIAEKPITVTVDKTSIDEVGVKVPVSGAKLELYRIETGTSGDNGHAKSFITQKKLETWVSDGTIKTFKALPKGNYVIKEVEVPKGYLPLEEDYKFEVKEVEEVQSQDIFNEPIPEVKTVAKFDTGVKESLPKEEVTVLDKFEYKKVLKNHSYEIRAKLVEKDNVSNIIAEDNKEFKAEDYKGEETLKFTFNAKELKGKRLVVLTELHRLDRKGNTLVAVHKDINNIDETIVIPKIKTTATDKKDGDKEIHAAEKQTIVDRVAYINLIIGRKYKVSGKLMDKETGKPVIDNGKEVTAEKEFTAETSNGFVDLEFTFNASALAGKTIVVFEDVYQDGKLVGTHSDIDDMNQSIEILEKEKVKTGDRENIIHSIFGMLLTGSILLALRQRKKH